MACDSPAGIGANRAKSSAMSKRTRLRVLLAVVAATAEVHHGGQPLYPYLFGVE